MLGSDNAKPSACHSISIRLLGGSRWKPTKTDPRSQPNTGVVQRVGQCCAPSRTHVDAKKMACLIQLSCMRLVVDVMGWPGRKKQDLSLVGTWAGFEN